MYGVRMRQLYTRLNVYTCTHAHTRAHAHTYAHTFIGVRALPRTLPRILSPSPTRSRRLHPRPSSLLTLPDDSCCPALSATLTLSISVASQSRTHKRMHTHVSTYTARHSAFPLHLSGLWIAGARASETGESGMTGETSTRERKIKKRGGATESDERQATSAIEHGEGRHISVARECEERKML